MPRARGWNRALGILFLIALLMPTLRQWQLESEPNFNDSDTGRSVNVVSVAHYVSDITGEDVKPEGWGFAGQVQMGLDTDRGNVLDPAIDTLRSLFVASRDSDPSLISPDAFALDRVSHFGSDEARNAGGYGPSVNPADLFNTISKDYSVYLESHGVTAPLVQIGASDPLRQKGAQFSATWSRIVSEHQHGQSFAQTGGLVPLSVIAGGALDMFLGAAAGSAAAPGVEVAATTSTIEIPAGYGVDLAAAYGETSVAQLAELTGAVQGAPAVLYEIPAGYGAELGAAYGENTVAQLAQWTGATQVAPIAPLFGLKDAITSAAGIAKNAVGAAGSVKTLQDLTSGGGGGSLAQTLAARDSFPAPTAEEWKAATQSAASSAGVVVVSIVVLLGAIFYLAKRRKS